MPMIVPSTSAMTRMTGTGMPGDATLMSATTMPVSARLAATDRSMHLVRMTIICPSAKRISGEVSLKTPARLDGVIKAGKTRRDQHQQNQNGSQQQRFS